MFWCLYFEQYSVAARMSLFCRTSLGTASHAGPEHPNNNEDVKIIINCDDTELTWLRTLDTRQYRPRVRLLKMRNSDTFIDYFRLLTWTLAAGITPFTVAVVVDPVVAVIA